MPVLGKDKHSQLSIELKKRFEALENVFESRELKGPGEGARGSWLHPENMCATIGNDVELRMAIDDFKTVLAEIKRLK